MVESRIMGGVVLNILGSKIGRLTFPSMIYNSKPSVRCQIIVILQLA